jgi:hypothetical protein
MLLNLEADLMKVEKPPAVLNGKKMRLRLFKLPN